MELDSKKLVRYALMGIGTYFAIRVGLSLFNIVFNIAFKILVLLAIVTFISYLSRK